MNIVLKNVSYAVVCSALVCSLYSCGNHESTSSTTTDSTSATATDHTAAATTSTTDSMAAAPAAPAVDKNTEFVTDVVTANAHEIGMLQAGIDHGTDKMLKSDAKKMIADHKKLAKDLQDFASKNSITAPEPTDMPNMSGLDGKTGKDWDKAWTDMMVEGHQKTIDRFTRAQSEVTNADLKDMITKTMPTLQKHLDMMTKLQSSLQ